MYKLIHINVILSTEQIINVILSPKCHHVHLNQTIGMHSLKDLIKIMPEKP